MRSGAGDAQGMGEVLKGLGQMGCACARSPRCHVRIIRPTPGEFKLDTLMFYYLFHRNLPSLAVCPWERLNKVQQHSRGWVGSCSLMSM